MIELADNNEETTRDLMLGKNIVKVGEIFGIKTRNLIEGIICAFLVVIIISNINFKPQIKLILNLSGAVLAILGNIKGIKNKSLSQNLLAEIKFRKRKRKLHLRSPEYIREVVNGGEYEDESAFERWTRKNKERIDRFVEENRTK